MNIMGYMTFACIHTYIHTDNLVMIIMKNITSSSHKLCE